MLFISDYPNETTIKDGMLQRVKAIDKHFEGEERTYLCISFRRFFKREMHIIDNNAQLIRCNFYTSFNLIYKLLRKETAIYIHSIHNGLHLIPFLKLLPHLKIIVDVHGAVPEELMLLGKKNKAKLFQQIEKYYVNKSSVLIVVTERMKSHLVQKYNPSNKIQWVVYPILPQNILDENLIEYKEEKNEIVTIIYSGNTQAWQNIDLMMQTINSHIENDHLRFLILTGEVSVMKDFLKKYNLDTRRNITVTSVAPSELKHYYTQANYGFILRDDNTVNQVACPTKMIEYLKYGIIPIVKYPYIGDFSNYYFILYGNLSDLKKIKSDKNTSLISGMMDQYVNLNFRKLINV